LNLPYDLLAHAGDLLGESGNDANEVDLRRSVSAAYYALLHRIIEISVALVAPNVSIETNHRIQRWFEHAKIKEICGRFLKPKLEQPLLGLIGESASPQLQTVCRNFVILQDARHEADYNLSYAIDFAEALKLWNSAAEAFIAWDSIRNTAEANIFILSLLLWKNWEKDR